MAAKSKTVPLEVVVTSLQMMQPLRKFPPMPINQHLALLKTRNMPLHFYRYLIDRVGRQWDWVDALRMSDEELTRKIGSKDRDIRVLYLDGSPAGFFDLDLSLPDCCQIAFFGLMDHASGRGIGRWFLGAAIEAAWLHAPAKIIVETCTLDHPAALPLYQKMGFEPVGQNARQILPLTAAERADAVMR